ERSASCTSRDRCLHRVQHGSDAGGAREKAARAFAHDFHPDGVELLERATVVGEPDEKTVGAGFNRDAILDEHRLVVAGFEIAGRSPCGLNGNAVGRLNADGSDESRLSASNAEAHANTKRFADRPDETLFSLEIFDCNARRVGAVEE